MSERLIPPGGEGKVEVKLSTRGKRGKLSKVVRVTSNDPETPTVTLQVNAFIEVLLGFSPQQLMLGDVKPGQTVTRTLQLVGKLADSATLGDIQAPPHLSIVAKPAATPHHVDLEVTVSPEAPIGQPLAGAARIRTDNPAAASVQLYVRGNVVGRVKARPQRVYARAQGTTEPAKLEFLVEAEENLKLKILSVTEQAGRFAARVDAVEPGRRYRVAAEVPASLLKSRLSGLFEVKTNDAEVPLLRVPYTVVAAPMRPAKPFDMTRPGRPTPAPDSRAKPATGPE